MRADPSYRAVAQRIATEIVGMPGVDQAALLVEQLAVERRPIHTKRLDAR